MRVNANGWKLIGIVVSVIWFVGFFLNQWHSRVTGVLDLYTIELIACYQPRDATASAEKHEEADQAQAKCKDKARADHARNFDAAKTEIPLLLVADFVTVVFGWLIAWMVVAVTRWIRRGFA
jgi:hypothetical protein